MKKIFCRRSRRSHTAAKRRWLRELLGRQRRCRKRGGRLSYVSVTRRRGPVDYIRLRAPTEIDIGRADRREYLLRFLRDLRLAALNGGSGITIDFRFTQKAWPAGMLLLVAEIDRALRMMIDRRLLRCNYPADPLMEQVFQQIGLLTLLGLPQRCDVVDEMAKHWRYATGVVMESALAGQSLERYDGKIAEPIRSGLYAGMIEAMANTIHHAYAEARNDGVRLYRERRWWMFSQEKDGRLSIAICDLGIGIPRSLPTTKTFSPESIVEMLKSIGGWDKPDASAIRAAVRLGQSSTNQANRGKGLSEVLDAVSNTKDGSAAIFSNRGFYGVAADRAEPVDREYPESIYGTVVEWHVPLS